MNDDSTPTNGAAKNSRDGAGQPAPGAGNERARPLGDNAGVYIPSEPEPALPPNSRGRELEVDFGGFVISLSTSGMINLGTFENPETGKIERDMAAARNIIQILVMLEQKTRGNLEAEEQRLIQSLIYDLKLAYVEANKGKQ